MLKELRQSKGLSQSELAKKAGINLRTLQSYECEARDIKKAGLDKLMSLASALGCEITDLFESKEVKNDKIFN